MTASMIRLYQALIDFGVMQRHIEVSKKGLKAELEDLEEMMDKEISSLNEHDLDAYFGNINDYWIETAETLPRLQWYAQLLIAYGYFEKLINDVCQEIKSERGISLSLNDLQGQGITRARNYLVGVAHIERPFTGHRWQLIKLVAKLRNAVAHGDGYMDYAPDNAKSTYSQISKIPTPNKAQDIVFHGSGKVKILIIPISVNQGDSFHSRLIVKPCSLRHIPITSPQNRLQSLICSLKLAIPPPPCFC